MVQELIIVQEYNFLFFQFYTFPGFFQKDGNEPLANRFDTATINEEEKLPLSK